MDYKKIYLLVGELLAGKNFQQVLNDHGLVYRYYLLDGILTVLKESYYNKYSLTNEEREFLIQLYNENCCQVKITNERLMIISDTHISSVYDTRGLEYLKIVLEICEKNGIKGLLHCGDIGDGTKRKENNWRYFETEAEARKEADYFIENYPVSPYVTQLLLGGNHDGFYFCDNTVKNLDIDVLAELVREYNKNPYNSETWRLMPMGYMQAICNYDGYDIFLEHQDDNPYKNFIKRPYNLLLRGHSHIAELGEDYMIIPTLSNRIYNKKAKDKTTLLPGFYIMNPLGDCVQIDRYYFENDEIKQASESKIYSLKK